MSKHDDDRSERPGARPSRSPVRPAAAAKPAVKTAAPAAPKPPARVAAPPATRPPPPSAAKTAGKPGVKPPVKAAVAAAPPVSRLPPVLPAGMPTHDADQTRIAFGGRAKATKAQNAKLAHNWSGINAVTTLDNMFAGMMEDARRIHGSAKAWTAESMANLIVGIPCPLVFEYLIASDVFPLGQVIHLHGLPKSNKSSMLFEFFRWAIAYNGLGNLFEAEDKLSPDFLPSIINWLNRHRVGVHPCESMEDWQRQVFYWVNAHIAQMRGTGDEPGPGGIYPVVMGVDSVAGKPAEETQEKVKADGAGIRNHPVEALKTSPWIRTIAGAIAHHPITLVLINHAMPDHDADGNERVRTGGGRKIGFQESLELGMSVFRGKLSCAAFTGRILKIECLQNAHGFDRRRIHALLKYSDEPDPARPGKRRQVTEWDWDWSLVYLLVNLADREKARLKEVFHIAPVATGLIEATAWSKTLGMTAKTAVSYAALGRMINARPDILAIIRPALDIKHRTLMDQDYLAAKIKAEKALR